MTTPDLTADGLPVGVPANEPATAPTPPPPAAVPTQPETAPDPSRRRRIRLILALILGALLLFFLAFALWYLLFRKPVSELPLPNLDQGKVPAFAFAAYDLQKPLGIAVSSDGGHIYVTQTGGGQETLVLDSKGTKTGELKPPADVSARASQIYVAVDPKTNDVYTTDRAAGRIYIYTADGTYKGILSPNPDPGVWQPLGIAFDKDGNLFVSDAGGSFQTVREIDRGGKVVLTIGEQGMFNFPNGIAVDRNGDIYITDSNNGRLMVFDSKGTKLGLVQRGPAMGEFSLPRGIAIDDAHRVFVVDAVGQSVQLYREMTGDDTAPLYLNRFGREGTVDGAFEFPNGIAVDGRGRVYVADWNNDRIQIWSY